MNIESNADVAVVIGRFQPFHHGHMALIKAALAAAPRVIVVLGSSFHARSTKNPFTWQERTAMIANALPPEEQARISTVAVRDYYEDKRWARAVRTKVEHLAAEAKRFVLIGYFKDASSYYLNHFPHWRLDSIDNVNDIDATRIRRILFEAENVDISLSVIEDLVPTATRQYLKAWSILPHHAQLTQEHQALEAYKASWKATPYQPIFSTVDAVVKTAGHVLLIRRGGLPGKGLWALPGGFVEPHERLLQAALRELCEETGLGLLKPTLIDALIDVRVFDHPERSLRGRTITHAHFFDLTTEHLPDVKGSDDAIEAAWVRIEQLAAMEEQFFEDHFHILDHFLQLTEMA